MTLPKRTIVGVFDELVEVDFYLEENRPQHQNLVGRGYPLNPVLRDDFCVTPNDQREQEERDDWWGLPYIESRNWQESETRLRNAQQAREDKLSSAEAEARLDSHKTELRLRSEWYSVRGALP